VSPQLRALRRGSQDAVLVLASGLEPPTY